MANYFGFPSLDALHNALMNPKTSYEHAGTGWSTTLYNQYHSTEFPSHQPYVVVWSRYENDRSLITTLQSYNGFVIVNDGGDSVLPNRPLFALCKKRNWIYIKQQQMHTRYMLQYLNSYNLMHIAYHSWTFAQSNPHLRIDPYLPTRTTTKIMHQVDTSSTKDRPIDLLFIGQTFKRLPETHAALDIYRQAGKELGLNIVIDDGKYPPLEYFKKLTEAKICLSFVGGGPRSRREWEVLLAGSLLLNDSVLRRVWGSKLPLLNENVHFVWQDPENRLQQLTQLLENDTQRLKIASQGHDLAKKCFFYMPTIQQRLIYAYFTDPQFVWDGSYEQLSQFEKQHDITSFPFPPELDDLDRTT